MHKFFDDFDFSFFTDLKEEMNRSLTYKRYLKDGVYSYEFFVPGLEPKDLEASVETKQGKDVLMLKIKNDSTFITKDDYAIILSEGIDKDSITAHIKNGILLITMKQKNYEIHSITIDTI